MPDRPQRINRNFVPLPGGDRYRPPQEAAHLHQTSRAEYDSYRPPYEDSWTPSITRESISAPMHRRGPSNPHQKRGQLDFRAGGPPVSPKMFNRFPTRRNRGPSFLHNHDRSIYPNDQMNYRGEFFHADHIDHGDDDDNRTKSPYSRSSSPSSIASTVPSEKHDEPSLATDPIVGEQSTPARETLAITEHSRKSSKSPVHQASPSPCPPGLHSVNNLKPMAFKGRGVAATRIEPSGAEVKDDDVTEENEVKEILSQSKLIDRAVLFDFVMFCNRSIKNGSLS